MTVELIPPELLSPRERAEEVARIIATANSRHTSVLPKKSEISLGFCSALSVHRRTGNNPVSKVQREISRFLAYVQDAANGIFEAKC